MGGTQYFTFEQKGAYLELLILQFNHGKFTESQVQQVLNTSYSNVWSIVKDKFKTDGTYYWNERMEIVKEERRLFVESRRNNRLGKKKEIPPSINDNTTLTSDEQVESESNSIPSKEVFLLYCKEVLKEKYGALEFSLSAKYDTWVADKWKDGNGNPILVWKTKIRNVIPHLKPMAASPSGNKFVF